MHKNIICLQSYSFFHTSYRFTFLKDYNVLYSIRGNWFLTIWLCLWSNYNVLYLTLAYFFILISERSQVIFTPPEGIGRDHVTCPVCLHWQQRFPPGTLCPVLGWQVSLWFSLLSAHGQGQVWPTFTHIPHIKTYCHIYHPVRTLRLILHLIL